MGKSSFRSCGLAILACLAFACGGGTVPLGNAAGAQGGGTGTASGGTTSSNATGGASASTGGSTSQTTTVGFAVSGMVEPGLLDAEGRTAALIWSVSSGSPDYEYKFGEATIRNGQFSIQLPTDPPVDATNSYGMGVGIVLVLASGVSLPDGKVTTNLSKSDILGISAQYAVIWLSATATLPDNSWPKSFPQGYACGVCVPSDASFDAFAATGCDQLKVEANSSSPTICNWT
jgi:hypothetical protein